MGAVSEPKICFDYENGDKYTRAYIQMGSYKVKLDMEELDGNLLERAKTELRETPEIKEKAIQELRALLESEPGLVIPQEENNFLLRFLRPCKFYPNSAFKLMKKYYKFKLKHPKLCSNLIPSILAPIIGQGVATFLPSRDKNGCRLMIAYLGSRWNTKLCSLDDLFRAVVMFTEIAMTEPKTQVTGAHVIFDFDGFSLAHLYQFGPSFAKNLLEWVQECVPVRLKGVHIVNEPRIFDLLYAIFKPFLIEKLKKRIIFHGRNFDKMISIMGQEFLPPCYGGTSEIGEVPAAMFAELLKCYENEWQDANAIGYFKEKVISTR